MSIYGPKAAPQPRARPDPRPTRPSEALGAVKRIVLVALAVVIIGLAMAFIVEQEQDTEAIRLLERAEQIRLDLERSRQTLQLLESAESLPPLVPPPRFEPIEPLQSAEIIPSR